MTFKISSKELSKKSTIVVEVSEDSLMMVRKRGRQALPADYWDFIPKDQQQEEDGLMKPRRRVLSHAKVAFSFPIHCFTVLLLLSISRCWHWYLPTLNIYGASFV